MARKLAFVALVGLGLMACAQPAEDEAVSDDSAEIKSLKGVTGEERAAYVRKAQTWLGAQPKLSAADILAGPKGKGAFPFNADVTCTFVEPTEKDELNGKSPKFNCKLDNGDVVKVKYSDTADENGEIYGEVMATRLLWTLGFPADRMYPVRVSCKGCPEDPWKAYNSFSPGGAKQGGARADRRYEHAVIEQKFDAVKIEQEGHEDQGWGWGEIKDDGANERAGGAPAGQLNGLKLLAAFMKHADNKAENQRLVCLKDGVSETGKCLKPVLMIQDAGVTFGGAAKLFGLVYSTGARARYKDWTSLNLWKDRSECKAELRDSVTGTMTHPHIIEAGRKFLAERLSTLDDDQISAIFTASRVEERGEVIEDIRVDAPSKTRKVTVDDWRIAFKIKRDEVVKHTCR